MSEYIWTINGMILDGGTDVFGGKSVPAPLRRPWIVHGLVLSNPGIRGKKPVSICQSRQNVTSGGTDNDPGGRKSWDKGVRNVEENHGDPLNKRWHPGIQTRCSPYTKLLI